jgi:hypothetical protein
VSGRQLSERETLLLRVIFKSMPDGISRDQLAEEMQFMTGSATQAGITRTVGCLCRKNLAWQAVHVHAGRKAQFYRITDTGRDALKGDMSGQWIARRKR